MIFSDPYSKYQLFWGDAHTNLHTEHLSSVENLFHHAIKLIDFWPIAYYPLDFQLYNGFPVENWIEKEKIEKDWIFLGNIIKERYKENHFVPFLGYEWQGNGNYGDHNIFYLDNNEAIIYQFLHFPELLKMLPKKRAIAIPHHTGYKVGKRGKNWEFHDENYSPFAEIFSSHGSSEEDDSDKPLYNNYHMGPGTSGGYIFDGLAKGNKFGIIASTDSHPIPAVYGYGLMGCYSEKLNKESLWEAFLNRRVYGVSGDRIKLKYSINNFIMGQATTLKAPYVHQIEIEGSNEIDRIEIYKNNLLIKTFIHKGTWENSDYDENLKIKFKLEVGWGPDKNVFKNIGEKVWKGILKTDGKIVSIEKCWKNLGQDLEILDTHTAKFTFTTFPYGNKVLETEALIFEIECKKNDLIFIEINGKSLKYNVNDILKESHLIGFLTEAKDLISKKYGLKEFFREDPFWHHSYKIKIHKAIPEIGYNVKYNFIEEKPNKQNCYYYLKAVQKDGHVAWSSPIWDNKN